jgi:hypothetical protein
MLSRQFGEAKKAKIKEEARLVAEAAAVAMQSDVLIRVEH